MSEMIERVAKVVAEHFDYDLDDLPKTVRDEWLQAARSAIEAMREPTERMVWAATASTSGDGDADGDYDEDVKCHWEAMIDEALR